MLSEVGAIAQDAARVQLDARNVVRAFDSLAAVAEENTAATEEMAASAMEVTRAVDRIAGVSQENASATEQVSASVEELTASAAEMASSAEGLSKIAEDLLQQVARFKV